VVTAVYILRVIAILLLGKINNNHYESLTDAKWHEKISTGVLIFGITAIGVAPLWLSNMINEGLGPIIQKLLMAAPIH
jgi:NADH-quinone oxidoreductase subunit M